MNSFNMKKNEANKCVCVSSTEQIQIVFKYFSFMIASSLEHVLSPLSVDTLSVITDVCLHVMDHL